MARKEDAIAKIKHGKKCSKILNFELKAAESNILSYVTKISSLRTEIKELSEKLKAEKAKVQSHERESIEFGLENTHLE